LHKLWLQRPTGAWQASLKYPHLLVSLIVAAAAVIAAPFPILQSQRTALAHWLVAHEFFTAGALVYQGAAWSRDAIAQNNLGVLKYRGLGTRRDSDAARRLFSDSAASGSAQAEINLALVDGGGCGLDHDRSAASARQLAPSVAGGNSGAATQTIDCLYFADARSRLVAPDGAMLDASRAIARTDGPARLKSGKALLNAARSIQLPGYGSKNVTQSTYDSRVTRLLERATIDLFAAAELGQAQAYEWLGIARHQFHYLLPRLTLGTRLAERSQQEWLEFAAENGDWGAQCRTASAQLSRLRRQTQGYSRQEFDAAVARARACLDREGTGAAPTWHSFEEYPAVSPHPSQTDYPALEIGATAGALEKFLFLDALARLPDQQSQTE
jgi:TPR repeat protein